MGIFDKIKAAIWGDETEAAPATRPAESLPGNVTLTTGIAPDIAGMTPAPVVIPDPEPLERAVASDPLPASAIDVSAKLDAAAAASGQKLDWRHSIVDLMKALGMDASLDERKELAAELYYTGDMHDSAKMNTFLHKALLQKLAENGGSIPPELLD
jgi:hypothetical protein